MCIEEKIFKKTVILYDQLIPYGFKKENEKYTISKNILNDSFCIQVKIINGTIKGKIYDLAFQEEYTNYRMENQMGAFVGKVREEFENFLIDIRENCTNIKSFNTEQANRISNLIWKIYKDEPKFLWEKFPGYGVFINPNNKKWYAVIANINKNKISDEDKEVEILNIKLDEKEVEQLLKQKSFYKAYHMNKKTWITIILDDSLKDEEIMNYIDKSYQLVNK